jgi:hypothetical protein
VGRGACFADYDTDGKVDAYMVNLGAPGTLLHNVSTPVGHWLKVRLVGTKSNRDGIGAVVEVEAGGVKQRAERTAGSGYLSQDDWRLHFGLGAATKADKITVVWPSGITRWWRTFRPDKCSRLRRSRNANGDARANVAHALVRAASAILPAPGAAEPRRVEKSLDAARTSAYATVRFGLALPHLRFRGRRADRLSQSR